MPQDKSALMHKPLNLQRGPPNSPGNLCPEQGLSQDLETGRQKLAIMKFLGVQICKGTTIYSDFNHKQV